MVWGGSERGVVIFGWEIRRDWERWLFNCIWNKKVKFNRQRLVAEIGREALQQMRMAHKGMEKGKCEAPILC